MNINDRFEQYEDDFLEFEKVENKLASRKDLHAFILLDKWFPHPDSDMVTSAEHDQIWLDVDIDDIEKLSDEQILELRRSGVFFDDDVEALSMFV